MMRPEDYDHDGLRGFKPQANSERRGIRRPETHAGGLPGLRREQEQPWHFLAVGEPATGPAGD